MGPKREHAMRHLRTAGNRRMAPGGAAGRRWAPAPAPPPRPCDRLGCLGTMRPRSYRLPARYVSRGRRGEPAGRDRPPWIWTCDTCGEVHQDAGPR